MKNILDKIKNELLIKIVECNESIELLGDFDGQEGLNGSIEAYKSVVDMIDKNLKDTEHINKIYKAVFSFDETTSVCGLQVTRKEIKLYGANTASELNTQIDVFLNDDKNSYRKCIELISIEAI